MGNVKSLVCKICKDPLIEKINYFSYLIGLIVIFLLIIGVIFGLEFMILAVSIGLIYLFFKEDCDCCTFHHKFKK